MKWLVLMVEFSRAGGVLMPPQGTSIAGEVDSVYLFLLWVSFISCAILIGGMIYFAIKYQRRTDNDKTPYITHNSFLEFLWSFVPLVIFMGVFAWGWAIYHKMQTIPENALEVNVFGYKWAWDFSYKSGKKTTNEIVVPVDQPVKLLMTSRDVIHSFFIPSMRIKQDVIPGRYTTQWFQAEKTGDYQVFCTEFCGDKHSAMLAKIKVVSKEDWEKWIQENDGDLPIAERGKKLYQGKCSVCHSLDGNKGAGPTWKGLWGQKGRDLVAGTVDVDENYIRESILNPNAKVVKGYSAGVMPTFQGALSEEEVVALIEFIKTAQ